MGETIKKLTIEGFKSIRKLEDFELRPLSVLIGANGAGKSNFVGFFRLLRELIEHRLQEALRTREGGADACLYMGPKVTPQFRAELHFGRNGYEFVLRPTIDNQFVFSEETTIFTGDYAENIRDPLGSGHLDARLKDRKDDPGISGAQFGVPHYVFDAISSWVVYHFHDTSLLAGVRRQGKINVDEVLLPDAANLAAFLYRIRSTNPGRYNQIRDVVRLAAPFFDDFKLRPIPTTPELIQLEWLQKDSDYPFLASQLSDGTLRFICLATALLQPVKPPTMLFDEPELGLHPYALTLLANLFRQATRHSSRQVIISTQSAQLLNEFTPEDVIVVERHQGESTFRRLNSADLSEWLSEYALGELWQKNILGGRPSAEDAPQLRAEWKRPFVTRVRVVVEGQTEESFVKDILAPALCPSAVELVPILLGAHGHQGGNPNYARVRKDILLHLKQEKTAYCSTMLDFYGLGAGFPGMPTPGHLSSRQKGQPY